MGERDDEAIGEREAWDVAGDFVAIEDEDFNGECVDISHTTFARHKLKVYGYADETERSEQVFF